MWLKQIAQKKKELIEKVERLDEVKDPRIRDGLIYAYAIEYIQLEQEEELKSKGE